MGRKSRAKGAQAERDLAALAREMGFPGAYREAPLQAGGRGNDVGGIPGLRVESKRYKRTPVARLLDAHLATEALGETSVLFWRDDRREWRVALDAREFLARWKELVDLRARRGPPEVFPARTAWDDALEPLPAPFPAVDPVAAGYTRKAEP